MAKHPNEWYTEGLLQQNPKVIRSIFSEFLPRIVGFARANSGTDDDARDMFMYALEIMYTKVKANDLTLTGEFFTFLYSVCQNHWRNMLRRKKYDAGVTPDDPVLSNTLGREQENYFSDKNEQQRLFAEKFQQIAKDCQKVLSLSWHTDMDMKAVAKAMGWTYAYARNRKHECKGILIKAVKADPRYVELRA